MKALKEGASYAVVDEEVGKDIKLIQVDDVLSYFQQLANMQRRAYDIPVIAIAGSNGKTTTKELVHAVLSQKFKTHMTAGNFNNHIGVPITLLNMPQDAEIAIVEIGTNSTGEIRALCQIVEPTHGVITNIGKEHLEGFGSLEAIAKEESELYHYLYSNNGHAFVNGQDEWLMRMSHSIDQKTIYDNLGLKGLKLLPRISFTLNKHKVESQLMGAHNLENILAAISIGTYFGVSDEKIAHAVSSYVPDNNRSQLIEKAGNLILLDAYNANPSSMVKAIESLSQFEHERKVLILGDMFELGDHAAEEHRAILDYCKELRLNEVYLLGPEFLAQAVDYSYTGFESMEELSAALSALDFNNTAFLIKGSRGMRMERAVDALD